jgi:hypothetical protein
MVSLFYIFWMYIILFAIIGGMRGWVKELIVSFAALTAVATNVILRQYLPLVTSLGITSQELFWLRFSIVIVLAFFGYQTVGMVPHLAAKAKREQLQEIVLGAVIGAINGCLIVGTLLFYLNEAKYPFPGIINPPSGPLEAAYQALLTFMPPRWLGIPWVFIVPTICLIFIVIVYI